MTIYIKQGHFADNYEAIETDDPFEWIADKIKTAPAIDEKAKAEYMISGKMQPLADGTYYRNDENLLIRDLIMIDYDFDNEPQDNFTINHNDFKAEIANKLQGAKYLLYPTFRADETKVRYRLVVPVNRSMDKDTYKVITTELVKLINIPTDKSAVDTWSQAQGTPVKSPKNEGLSPVIIKEGNPLNVYPRAVIDSKIDEIEQFISSSPLFNATVKLDKQPSTQNDIKIDRDMALNIMADYIAVESKRGNLIDYTNSLSVIQTLAKAVQEKAIDIDTARECVVMIATGNQKWEKENLKKLDDGIKKPVKTTYTFLDKFVKAAGLHKKYGHLLENEMHQENTTLIRAEIEATDLSSMTINNVPKSWLHALTDEEIAELHKNTSPSRQLDHFFADMKKASELPPVSTGFKELDKVLDGGLYAGLYFVGAISSLGKTTFLLQMADQIAKQQRDVLIFSLEMSRYQIMSKTLSRLTYEISRAEGKEYYHITDGKGYKVWNARTSRQITDMRRYNGYTDYNGEVHKPYSDYQKELIGRASNEYRQFADHIYIHEGVGDIGVDEIREAVDVHTKATGHAPIIILDYLQILTPTNDRASDKQNTDKAVVELKRISRDYDTPVMAISSLNRENYSKGISMTAYKESGAIEYSSDVLIGLQFAAQGEADRENKGKSERSADYKRVDIDEEKNKEPREIELKLLKQRDGQATGNVYFEYHSRFNHYEETFDNEKKSTNRYGINISEKTLKGKAESIVSGLNLEEAGDGIVKVTKKQTF